MKKRIIISVTNDLSSDQRVDRVATTLHEAGAEVTLIGRSLPHSLPLKLRPYECLRFNMFFRRGKFFYLEYNIRLFLYLLGQKFHYLHANDLDTLLANFLASRLKGKPLVYDSHEYFTEVPELQGRKLTRSIWLTLERWIFPRLKQAFTVNDSLAGIFSEKYNVPVRVMRNLPLLREFPQTRSAPGEILIYQGALNLSRGIELMIRSMKYLPENVLWIAGNGDVKENLVQLVKEEGLKERVQFLGFVLPEKLKEITLSASLGFSLEEDAGENYHFALPNKLFDYIQAGVPVLVSDLPEMRSLVQSYKVGEVLGKEERTPEKLAEKVREMLQNEEKWLSFQENCLNAAKELCWEKEKDVLASFYDFVPKSSL
ncbi:MAG: glycosyltransferase [Bacteroidia bacterium]|nr:glycosyltransferase [Bacteroidia bacterium]